MARGGRRAGAPGQSYSNRTDLNVVRAPTAPPNMAPPQSGPLPAQPTQTAAAPAGPPIPQPGTLGSLLPTQRPGEPITHGLPSGPGGGPEVLQRPFTPDPLIQAQAVLSSIPAIHQTPQLRALAAASSASIANSTSPTIVQGPQ